MICRGTYLPRKAALTSSLRLESAQGVAPYTGTQDARSGPRAGMFTSPRWLISRPLDGKESTGTGPQKPLKSFSD